MSNREANGAATTETLLQQDDRDHAGWVIAISPSGRHVGKLTHLGGPGPGILAPVYDLNRGLQVSPNGQAQIITKVFPCMLYPEIEELAMPEGTAFIPFSALHKNSRQELYGEIKLCVENIRRMRAMLDGAQIILPNVPGMPVIKRG